MDQQRSQQDEANAQNGQGQQSPALRRDLVHTFGHPQTLSLDGRMRFRLPGELAEQLQYEMGRVEDRSNVPMGAGRRMGFYFVPGTRDRIFLYPAQNIEVAISRFESPPAGVDPEQVRKARDYFYSMMTFVETDKQNRLQIPQHLCEHADLDEGTEQIALEGHNLWLTISRAPAAEQIKADGREALEKVGPQLLDPVNFQQSPGQQGPAQDH